jgi:hypothetical protein
MLRKTRRFLTLPEQEKSISGPTVGRKHHKMVDEKMKNFPEIDYASLPIHPSDAVSICD